MLYLNSGKFAVRGPYMLARTMNIFNNNSLFQTMSDQNHLKISTIFNFQSMFIEITRSTDSGHKSNYRSAPDGRYDGGSGSDWFRNGLFSLHSAALDYKQ